MYHNPLAMPEEDVPAVALLNKAFY